MDTGRTETSSRIPPLVVDLAVVAALAGLLIAVADIARQWEAPMQAKVAIDISPWALPGYALLSLARGLAAFACSLLFAVAVGWWAARDRRAGRILLPLLDVLQSIPVLGFMPGLVLALVALIPHHNAGLELSAVLMIFTGQVWNMTFSVHRSLSSLPRDLDEAATALRFRGWRRFFRFEMPCAVQPLVWNGMMGMAGGWFFLMVCESFQLGDEDFRLAGLGSYMSVAAERGDVTAQVCGVAAMMLLILALDQLLWRPLVAWAERFRLEEGSRGSPASSWMLDLITRSRLLAWLGRLRRRMPRLAPRADAGDPGAADRAGRGWLAWPALVLLVGLLAWGAVGVVHLVGRLGIHAWIHLLGRAGLTLARVAGATLLGTLWAIPAGLLIGTSRRWSRILQPLVQMGASFPAPMLFPMLAGILLACHVPVGLISAVLILAGTSWYILFNVVAGASSIPAELAEAGRAYAASPWRRFRTLWLPAILPQLVVGWVTAVGGGWNASIVAEYLTMKGSPMVADGLGAEISRAADNRDLPTLAAAVLVMAVAVVAINRLVWQPLQRLAETRYAIGR